MMKPVLRLIVIAGAVALTACQTPGRYAQKQDSEPTFTYEEPLMEDMMPRYEPYRSFNFRPYEVLGKRYYPMQTGKGYEQEGLASWYGQKFHGHLTSNGEAYNMFMMTAAHKTLPLPSFVKVTNLSNGKTAVVRVNDRGPFHEDRIIDLSYAAAKKLGYQKHGTARVKLEVIHFDQDNNVTVGSAPTVPYEEYAGLKPAEPVKVTVNAAKKFSVEETDVKASPVSDAPAADNETFIQVAALSDLDKAKSVSTVLSALYQVPTQIPFIDDIYKLRLGPLKDRFQVQMLLEELKNNGYPNAYTVQGTL